MTTKSHPKILISGCGLSGMLMSLSLARLGFPSVVIEKKSTKDSHFFSDPRAIAITFSSKVILESFGIWSKISEFVSPFNDIYVVDNKLPNMVHFSSSMLSDDQLMGSLIEAKDFKKILYELVLANDLITIIDEVTYEVLSNSKSGCHVILSNKKEFICDLLIACDGYNSYAKQKYFSSKLEKSYNQHALTFIAHHEKPHEGTAVEHFMSSGPFATLPLKDPNLSSVVWTINSDEKDLFLSLPNDEFLYLVQQNFGEFLGKIQIKDEISAFPLRAYITKKYYNNKIVLISDTAHVIHPLAGQGLNQGIKDIKELSDQMSAFGVSEASLEIYEKRRKNDNVDMLEITDQLNSVFSYNSRTVKLARQLGFSAIENIPVLKKLLVKYAMGRR